MIIQDENGVLVDIEHVERNEQDLARHYIRETDVVFELGARYGSVSCVINSKLNCKTNQVVVEPDSVVWGALERNKQQNNCGFHIIKGFISNKKLGLLNPWSREQDPGGYAMTSFEDASSTIPTYTLDEIKSKYNLNFNVLVADCEGFLETFLDENPSMYDTIRLILFEADCPDKCNYDKIRHILHTKGFTRIQEGHQNVWFK